MMPYNCIVWWFSHCNWYATPIFPVILSSSWWHLLFWNCRQNVVHSHISYNKGFKNHRIAAREFNRSRLTIFLFLEITKVFDGVWHLGPIDKSRSSLYNTLLTLQCCSKLKLKYIIIISGDRLWCSKILDIYFYKWSTEGTSCWENPSFIDRNKRPKNQQ